MTLWSHMWVSDEALLCKKLLAELYFDCICKNIFDSGSRGKCHQQSFLELSPSPPLPDSPPNTLICGKASQYLSSELIFSGKSDWLLQISLARRSHRVASRKLHLNETKPSSAHRPPPPPFFSFEFSEMHPCSSLEPGLQQRGLRNSLRLPLDLPCSLIIHLPVGYLADVSLTRVGDLMEEEGEVAEMRKRGGKLGKGEECQEWIQLEEERLPGSNKRWEV